MFVINLSLSLSQFVGNPMAGFHTHHQVSSNFYMFVNFVSLIEAKKVNHALNDAGLISVMQGEFHEFKRNNMLTLVPHTQGKTIVGTCLIFRKKMDEDYIITRRKARLVSQGFTQLKGLDYDETFSPISRLEPTRLFLAYAYFMTFRVFQYVKTAFLHGDLV